MLELRLKQPTDLPIDARGLLPEVISTVEEACRCNVQIGNQRAAAGDLFHISGDPTAQRWTLLGDCSRIHCLGRGMSLGELIVEGHVGRHCGAQMRGGSIAIQGNAGHWLGAQMQGGSITVGGSAGNHVGGAYPGFKFGMRNGAIIIHGDVGHGLGRAMRRGLILVAGDCGRFAAHGMRAGTILVLGHCDDRPGLQMLRGTLGLFGDQSPGLPPTFRRACRIAPSVLALMRKHVRAIAGQALADRVPFEAELYNGDLLRGGRGEVLVR